MFIHFVPTASFRMCRHLRLFLLGSFFAHIGPEKKIFGFLAVPGMQMQNSNHWLTHLSANHPRKLPLKFHTYALRFSANSWYNSAG